MSHAVDFAELHQIAQAWSKHLLSKRPARVTLTYDAELRMYSAIATAGDAIFVIVERRADTALTRLATRLADDISGVLDGEVVNA